jgi:hypothetical protein
MRLTKLVCLSAVLTAAVGMSGCDIKAGEHGGFSLDFAAGKATDTWTRTYKVASGGRVELINVNGRISAEPATGDSLELVGERTVKASSDEAAKEMLAKIEMNEEVSGASVRVEVRSAKSGGRMFGYNNAQIRWTVKVPKGVEVRLKTTNGGVELTGLENSMVRVQTTNGGVVGKRLAATDVEASAVNGGVEIELSKSLPADGRIELDTVNGGVGLELPETSRATITARAVNGGVKVLELDVDVQGEQTRRRLEGTLNGGGARVNLSTTNGGVRVARAAGRPTS